MSKCSKQDQGESRRRYNNVDAQTHWRFHETLGLERVFERYEDKSEATFQKNEHMILWDFKILNDWMIEAPILDIVVDKRAIKDSWWWWWWVVFVVWLTDEKAFSLICSRDHWQRSSPSRISDTEPTGFEPAQNLCSGLVEWGCAVVITTTPRHQRVWCSYPKGRKSEGVKI